MQILFFLFLLCTSWGDWQSTACLRFELPGCRELCDINFVLKCANSFFFFLLFSETNVIIADFSHLNPCLSFGKRPLLPFFFPFFLHNCIHFQLKTIICVHSEVICIRFVFPFLLVWFLNVISELELSSFNSNGIMPNPLRLAGKWFWAWCHLAFLRKGLLMKHRKKIRLFQTCKTLKLQGVRSDRAFTNTPNILWHDSETTQEIPS